jgi:glycosyltransferase involved in cell wall biosynthesis
LILYKILIVSQSHLCRNPRVFKEATALSRAGFRVTVLTAIYSEQLLQEDLELIKGLAIGYEHYSDLRHRNPTSLRDRLVRKLASGLNAMLNWESPFSLGFGVNRLLRACNRHQADLYIMHQELATFIGCRLLARKCPVLFDLEDWYSEDLLEGDRKKRPVRLLKKLEKYVLENAVCWTTSHAMARGLQQYYQSRSLPAVIYNSFDAYPELVPAKNPGDTIHLYWFSQTIGPGRGIEFFMEGMSKSDFSWKLTLRGRIDPYYAIWLRSQVHQKDCLILEPMLKNEDLLPDLISYDMGLALEPCSPPNKNLTISNKFFHYLSAGLPIIASNTQGHLEVGTQHPEFVFLYQNEDISSLITLLNHIGRSGKSDLHGKRKSILEVYQHDYSWDQISQKLTNLIYDQFNPGL